MYVNTTLNLRRLIMNEWGDIGYWIILMGILTVLGDLWIRVYKIQNELRKWRKEWKELQK